MGTDFVRLLHARAASAFDDCPFVRIVEGSPRVAAVAGTNFADIGVAANENTSAIMVALDNLGKGMAGQAVPGDECRSWSTRDYSTVATRAVSELTRGAFSCWVTPCPLARCSDAAACAIRSVYSELSEKHDFLMC